MLRVIFKEIYTFITDQYTLFDNPLYNYFAMGIVLAVAFVVAWNFVGSLYDNDIIETSFMGSLIHWIARFVIATILFIITSAIIWVIKFIIQHWIAILIVIISIVLCIGIIVFICCQKKRVK